MLSNEKNGDVMRIIIFGTGTFYANRQDSFCDDEIIAFIDNDRNKWNKRINNVSINSPSRLNQFSYDKIVIMSRQKHAIKNQLMYDIGIEETSILDFEEYCESTAKSKDLYELVIHYKRNHIYFNNKKTKVLIITYVLNYSGSSLAAFYAALALKNKGFDVAIVTWKADRRLISEITNMGVTVLIQKLLDFCTWEQMIWIEQFDYVIVNTLPLWRIIKELINNKPILWWIHESNNEYEYLERSIVQKIDNLKAETYVVSDVALQTFNRYFNKLSANILQYGIPDKGGDNTQFINRDKIVFAIIGGISSIKAQDIFLQAITQLTLEERNKSEFWMIGACLPENQYGISILKQAETIPEVKWLGELNRKEIEEVYKSIDVVVVPSRQDSLPIVATEAFMYGKILVASNVIGTVKYIIDKENGLIFESENVGELAQKISWVLNNSKRLSAIRIKARQTYERNFTLEVFGEKLKRIIENIK